MTTKDTFCIVFFRHCATVFCDVFWFHQYLPSSFFNVFSQEMPFVCFCFQRYPLNVFGFVRLSSKSLSVIFRKKTFWASHGADSGFLDVFCEAALFVKLISNPKGLLSKKIIQSEVCGLTKQITIVRLCILFFQKAPTNNGSITRFQ